MINNEILILILFAIKLELINLLHKIENRLLNNSPLRFY